MTVTYTAKIASVKFKTLWKLLKRWRGSVYKHLWKDALLFVTLYFTLSFIYRFALTASQKIHFEKLVLYCKKESSNIPVAFVLGFYVTIIVNRWWAQVNDSMPYPDTLAINITALVHGNDDRGRLMRRTLMRYVNLSWILSLCSISTVAKKRFPTLEHLVEIGMMTKNEQEIFDNIKTTTNKYYVPLVWATALISRARKEDRVREEYNKIHLLQLISDYRTKLGALFNYDWLSVPLVYTQVVTIAVQAYFLANVVGAQFLENSDLYPDRDIDIYVPVFTLLQFLFYMGWLKVAESLINPFGEDDDDFDTNWVIDRNLQVSYLIVDEMHSEYPELIKDAYWDAIDVNLPYTVAAEQYKTEPYLGSTNEIELKEDEILFTPKLRATEEAGTDNRETATGSKMMRQSKGSQGIKTSLQRRRDTAQRTKGAEPTKRNEPLSKPMTLESKVEEQPPTTVGPPSSFLSTLDEESPLMYQTPEAAMSKLRYALNMNKLSVPNEGQLSTIENHMAATPKGNSSEEHDRLKQTNKSNNAGALLKMHLARSSHDANVTFTQQKEKIAELQPSEKSARKAESETCQPSGAVKQQTLDSTSRDRRPNCGWKDLRRKSMRKTRPNGQTSQRYNSNRKTHDEGQMRRETRKDGRGKALSSNNMELDVSEKQQKEVRVRRRTKNDDKLQEMLEEAEAVLKEINQLERDRRRV